MKPIFGRGPSLQLRLLVAIILAISIMFADSRMGIFCKIRIYIDNAVSPFYFLAKSLRKILDVFYDTWTSRQQLLLENKDLKHELIIKNSRLLILDYLKQENMHLRELLASPLHQKEEKVMMTEVISTVSDRYVDQVIIDKGTINGVYEGQSVISDKGLVGQVVSVGKITSRVILICDASHALPIQILRNNIRLIASGNGCNKNLKLKNIPSNTDIHVGDMLVTSGLGGRFPPGYPVGIVSSAKIDTKHAYIKIEVRPIALLNRLQYLLLLWGVKHNDIIPTTFNKIHGIAKEHLIYMQSHDSTNNMMLSSLPTKSHTTY